MKSECFVDVESFNPAGMFLLLAERGGAEGESNQRRRQYTNTFVHGTNEIRDIYTIVNVRILRHDSLFESVDSLMSTVLVQVYVDSFTFASIQLAKCMTFVLPVPRNINVDSYFESSVALNNMNW